MTITEHLRYAWLLLIAGISIFRVGAININNISNTDGLSNSAVLSLCQDYSGMLWVGTCDGVNLYDGNRVYNYSILYPESPLCGNIIEGIFERVPGEMWVRTNFGMNRINVGTGDVKVFTQFHGHEKVKTTNNGRIMVIDQDGHLLFFDNNNDQFITVNGIRVDRDNILSFGCVADHIVIFGKDGIKTVKVSANGTGFIAGEMQVVSRQPLLFASNGDRIVYLVTAGGELIQFDLTTFSSKSIMTVGHLLNQRGDISEITTDKNNNIYIAFATQGAIRVDCSNKHHTADLGINVGVFTLLASKAQDVVWIGSDCGGVYTCSSGPYDVNTISFHDLDNIILKPVRTVYVDDKNNLWIGTKGDGLLQLTGFDTRYATFQSKKLWKSDNSNLRHNAVFAISPSSRPRLWIGGEDGLNIYDYNSGQLKNVDTDVDMRWIHGVIEEGDSILWTASIGLGVFRSKIDNSHQQPRLYDTRHYLVGDRSFSDNYFFSATVDNNGTPVFSNRGKGAYIYDSITNTLKRLTLREDTYPLTVNDVFSTIKEDTVLWLGTGNGMLMQTPTREKLFMGTHTGFSNSTIHSLLKDKRGDIWASTNKGLVVFDLATERTRLIDSKIGVGVSEYSDGAAHITPDSLIIFGGIDGIAMIRYNPTFNDEIKSNNQPRLIGLSINGKDISLHNIFTPDDNTLSFNHDQSYINLLFSAPEFINPGSITMVYSFDGREWIYNGNDNQVSLNSLSPGRHKLYIKTYNHDLMTDSDITQLEISVSPPWYISNIAIAIYIIIFFAILSTIGIYTLRRQRLAQRLAIDRMRQTHKEELYEEKLRFFTNITHEFCTPLTLIAGPCERILSYEKSDSYIRKYASLIFTNGQRLNNLIQEIIDLRRIESGHSPRKVRHIDVSDLCNDTIATFDDMAERNHITVVNEVTPGITWNTDYSSINKIITNLISNAFKYTPAGGTIKVKLDKNPENKLRLEVWNTGKGIRPEDKERIFNRYAILDNIEEKVTHGLSARNGLGMAICLSMVEQLEGKIEIDSVVDSYASFIVTLPQLEIDTTDNQVILHKPSDITKTDSDPTVQATDTAIEASNITNGYRNDSGQPKKLLIVDDNEEMLTLLTDSFSEYDVTTASDGSAAIDLLKKSVFDLIITDVMMPGTNGLDLARQIKANRHTAHIPLIILSAKVSNDEIIEGIESGADLYIRKPFSFGYLRAMISRLIQRQQQLREYYNTAGSAYMYEGGQLMSREDKEFIDNLTTFIDSNIEDSDLSIDRVAQHLNMSTRNLYRRLKELEMSSPNDFIKEHRLSSAARLLCTTCLTVQEIMFRTGFSNRSHFYREFAKRYQMTPKEYRTANCNKDESLGKPQ